MSNAITGIVLAAGKGTRMKSARPKVLHELCGRPMLWYVLRALRSAGVQDVIVVTSDELQPNIAAVATAAGVTSVRTALQEPQLGTGHAVQIALAAIEPRVGTVVVVHADMPLIDAGTIERLIAARNGAVALVTARMPLPSNFGRIVRRGDAVERIVEVRDASPAELAIDEMNAGLYAFDDGKLRRAVAGLTDANAQREYYLPDAIALLASAGERATAVPADDHRLVLGVNDRAELAIARRNLNARLCEQHMRAGVAIVDPATTYLQPDLAIAPDVSILPNTSIGGATTIGAHSEIGPNSRLVNAHIGQHVVVSESVVVDSRLADFVVVGPFAHVRGNTDAATGVRIGNFVELKNAKLAPGVRAGHLTYLGDAVVGARANIGAGTITCNFDGRRKNKTEIGKDAFIGSNSSLVAPLKIGARALTGAGAVVIADVEAGERVAGNPARPLKGKKPKAERNSNGG